MKHLLIAILVSLLMAACGDDIEYCDCGGIPVIEGCEIVKSEERDDFILLWYNRDGEYFDTYGCDTLNERCKWQSANELLNGK